MKAKLKTISILLIAILAGVFTSCMKDENITDSENNNGKGTVKFFLTDAPFPSDQVAEANDISVLVNESTTANIQLQPSE